MLDNAAKDLRRIRHIGAIVAKYGFKAGTVAPSDAAAEPGVASLEGPKRFRLMLEELGPTFIKLGQVLSSRPDLVSRAYIDELKNLQADCTALSFDEIEEAVEAGLGDTLDNLFADFDHEPIATASIAQVHRATTLGGIRVVVKVQRPGIKEEIDGDTAILRKLGALLEAVIEESALADPVAVIDEFEAAMNAELDFNREAANVREFARTHAGREDIVVPAVHPGLSSATVLTMDWLDGVPFSNLPQDIDKKKLAERILREGFDEIFIDGFFHGDPHPGNILLLSDGRYGIIDFGLCGRLTPQMRETLVILTLAVALKDADTAARTVYRLGTGDARASLSDLRDDLNAHFNRYLGKSIKDVDASLVLQDLLGLVVKHKIRIPPEYALLGRSSATIEGIIRELDPEIDIAKVSAPYAEQLLMSRVAPGEIQGGLYRTLLQFQGYSQDVPLQLTQILSDLAGGNLAFQLRGPAVDRLTNTILMATMAICFSILGGAFVVGAFATLAQMPWQVHGIPIVALLGGMAGATIFSWVAAYVVFRPKLKKISLGRVLALFKRKKQQSSQQ